MTRLRLVAAHGGAHSGPAHAVLPPGVDANCCERDAWQSPLGLLAPLFAGHLEPTSREAWQGPMREFAFVLADLVAGARQRAVVVGADRREIGVERLGDELAACAYRPGAEPVILCRELRLPLEVARRCLLSAMTADEDASDRGLRLGTAALSSVRVGAASAMDEARVEVASAKRLKLRIHASFQLRRPRGDGPANSEARQRSDGGVTRADLHALLFAGTVTCTVGKSERRLDAAHVFLVAERLVALAAEASDARASGRPLVRRAQAGVHRCGVVLDARGRASLLVMPGPGVTRSAQTSGCVTAAHPAGWGVASVEAGARSPGGFRMPEVDCAEFVRAVTSFARSLCRALSAFDRSHGQNLRVAALARASAELGRGAAGTNAPESRLNRAPESYRAFAEASPERAPTPPPTIGRLRFSESWRAEVAGLDLRTVLLCGDRLVVGASRELCALDRATGQMIWQRPVARAASILTPLGLLRLRPDGTLSMLSLADGSEMFELRIAPCTGASTSAAVVTAPGLPRLLLVNEGSSDLCAIDLDTGEVRWRRRVHRPRSGAPLRLRRAGKLVIANAAEPDLCAIDVASGEEVWRHTRRNGCFVGTAFEGGDLFALRAERASGRSATELEIIDAWTGAVRVRTALPREMEVASPPLVAAGRVLLPTLDDGRIGLCGVDRTSGDVLFDAPASACEAPAAWLVVDDAFVANSDGGELTALDAADGRVRYRHVLPSTARLAAADRPESLRPVLRSGALFVPQAEVYVVRPRDGALLGRLDADIIPDVMRVDERCGVYVAELSGHVAAFAALPSLQLVT